MARSATPLLVLVALPLLSINAAGLRGAREDAYPLGLGDFSGENLENVNHMEEHLIKMDVTVDAEPVQIIPDLETIGKSLTADSTALVDFLVKTLDLRLPFLLRRIVARAGLLPVWPRINTECGCKRDSRACSCCATVSSMFSQGPRKGCLNVAYDPERVAVRTNVTLNGDTLLDRELFSGANPPPICFPVPQLPIVNVCVRVYNISMKDDRQLQVCGALESGLTFAQSLVRVRLGCLHSGAEGVTWHPAPPQSITGTESPEASERLVVAPFKTNEESEFGESEPLQDGFFDTNAKLTDVYGDAEAN